MSVETRLFALAQENLELGRDPDWDLKLSESDISSMDAVAFIKAVGEDFSVTIPPEEVAKFNTIGDLIAYVDSHSG